jgi:hypothetical protein
VYLVGNRDRVVSKDDLIASVWTGRIVSDSTLTAAAAMAGRCDAAEAALRELRRVQPNISLAWVASQIPTQHDAELSHYLETFRRAGLE